MPCYYFDCLSNGVLHPDDFGLDMVDEDIADQAQAVMMDIMAESLPSQATLTVIVTVRSEQGQPVYVAHGVAGGDPIK